MKNFLNKIKSDDIPLSGYLIKAIFYQILSGLCHLDRQNLLHSDIKPDNILLKPDGRITIIDFGSCIGVNKDEKKLIHSYTIKYAAPEVLNSVALQSYGKSYCDAAPHEISSKADVYSMGMTLTELLTGDVHVVSHLGFGKKAKRQYKLLTQPKKMNAFEQKREQKIRKIYKDVLSEEEISSLISLLNDMTKIDPDKRISAKEALKNPFFLDFSMDLGTTDINTKISL